MLFQSFPILFILIIDKYANEISKLSNGPNTSVKLSNGVTGVQTMCNNDSLGLKDVFMDF